MKPGEHPEFFRFPAPGGASRESGIVLDGQGRFWHDGAVIERASMTEAFSRWLRRHPDDGRYILSNGYDWTYIEVQDVPFFVRTVLVDQDPIQIELSDGSREALCGDGLRTDARSGALYLRVKGGAFEARMTPAAQTTLAPLLETTPDGAIGLRLGGELYAVE